MNTLQDLFGLKGKSALVTGASSGLGVEFALALAQAGADVVLMARRRERLEAVARDVEALGVRCLPAPVDLTEDESVDGALRRAEEAFGGVDILVNNAGTAPFGKAEQQTRGQWAEALGVNLTAGFVLSQKVARGMIARQRGGRIINVSSVLGQVANAIYPTVGYCASKGALELVTRQLAVEWAPHGITVNAIAPGWFPTEMNIDPRFGDVHPKHKQRMVDRIPLGRLGNPAEVRGAVVYLASAAASYVTGTTLVVDGGWLAW